MLFFCALLLGSRFLTAAQAQTNPYSGTTFDNRYESGFSTSFSSPYDTDNQTLTGSAAAQQACDLFRQQAAKALRARMNGSGDDQGSFAAVSDATLRGWALTQGQSALNGTINSALDASCAAIAGQETSASLDTFFGADQITHLVNAAAFNAGVGVLKNSGLPFTTRLEISGSLFSRGGTDWEILSVQPLWQDTAGHHHVFTQVSWNRTMGRAGYADGDTVNAGLAYRRLSDDKKILYGVNAFFDHALDNNHNRMSLGADVQTSQLGASVNRYIPLSDWRRIDTTTEEKASDGWDIQLQGRIPQLPAWQLNMTGYHWSSNAQMNDKYTFGYDTTVQWQPFNGLLWEFGGGDETGSSLRLHANLRLVYKFGEPIEKMWERPTALRDVSDRVYDKVRRENAVRVTRRSINNIVSPITVLQTVGANTGTEGAGAPQALANGMTLERPVTIDVSAAGGSVVQVGFADGGVLTLGANTSALIEANLITLISGTLQYISGATNVSLAAPGTTIVLLGTDIDLSTNGATSTLRVRDGRATMTGTTSGMASLNAGQAASANGGVIAGTLATTDAAYIAHVDTISENIDRVAAVQSGAPAAPYPFSTAEMIQPANIVGDVIKIGISYSKAVSITGTPQLALHINGNDVAASYSAGDSTPVQLVFAYTLTAADIGATFVTSKHIQLNGGTIQNGAQPAVTTMADTNLSLGGTIAPPQDDTPDAFTFAAVTNTAWNSPIDSAAVTITGIGPAAVNVSITGDGTPQFNINGSGWVTGPALIENGQTLQLRLTSANTINTQRSATVTVGTENATWNVTTINDQCLLTSPAPGVTCADGSLFAGFSPDGGHKMYTTALISQGSTPWSSNGLVTSVQTFQTSEITGRANTAALAVGGLYEDSDSGRAGVQPHSAANGCANLNVHGRTDWYLPALDELRLMYDNMNAQLVFNSGEHWTSTEVSRTAARPLHMGNRGTTQFRSKTDFRPYRCVRREG